MGVWAFDVNLTKPSPSMLCAEVKSRRKIQKPKGGKPLKAIPGGNLSPTSSGLRSSSATVFENKSSATTHETRSAATRRRPVSP